MHRRAITWTEKVGTRCGGRTKIVWTMDLEPCTFFVRKEIMQRCRRRLRIVRARDPRTQRERRARCAQDWMGLAGNLSFGLKHGETGESRSGSTETRGQVFQVAATVVCMADRRDANRDRAMCKDTQRSNSGGSLGTTHLQVEDVWVREVV